MRGLLLKKQGSQSQHNAEPSRRDEGVNGGELGFHERESGFHFLVQAVQAVFYGLKAGFQPLEEGMVLLDAAFQIGDSFRQRVNGHRVSVT